MIKWRLLELVSLRFHDDTGYRFVIHCGASLVILAALPMAATMRGVTLALRQQDR